MTCRLAEPKRNLDAFLRGYGLLWFPAAGAWALSSLAVQKQRIIGRLALRMPARPAPPGPIWIHALSVGEVLSALPLVKALPTAFPNSGLVFTAATTQGLQVAEKALAGNVERLLPMPLDFPWALSRIVGFIRPSIFILVETDIWPGLLCYLEHADIPRVLVNGRISPRTFSAYRRLAPFARKLFDRFSLCMMQTPLDRDRLLAVGVSPDRVLAVGNIKFDHERAPMEALERSQWRQQLGLQDNDRLWVAGSTHPGEEASLLAAFKRLLSSTSRLRLIIAPRRMETSGDLLHQALRLGLKATLRSETAHTPSAWEVLVLDSLGELGRLYGLADVSFVGGSLVPMGGHNLLEPAAFGCPVLFGPHTFNFDLMASDLESSGGGMRVWDEQSLYAGLASWLQNERQRSAAGAAALSFVARNRGNVQRVVAHIDTICKGLHQ
jgi:3-deoxy-D-manno-octulosonic-acid transferase